jgi:hypothetical protein
MRTAPAPVIRGVVLGLLIAAAGAGTALATPVDACTVGRRACAATCDQDYPAKRDDMGHAGCLARCSWDDTACTARQALDDTQTTLDRDVKPWLADQAGRWQRFLDGFRGRGGAPQGGEFPHSSPPDARPGAKPDRNPDRGTSL